MEWAINDEEKRLITETFLRFYEGVDRISIVVALPLFKEAGNSKDTAERTWRLIDSNEIGRLTFGEFMVGMHIAKSRVPGAKLPTSIPENLKPLLNLAPPFPVEDALQREERILVGPSALDSNLAKWAFRCYNDSFPLLSTQALRVIAYLSINPFGLTKTIRNRVHLNSIAYLLKTHLSHRVHGHICATILCVLSASFPQDVANHSAWIARLCVSPSTLSNETRLLLMVCLSNCASSPISIPKIMDNSVSRSSPPWLTSFVNQVEREQDAQLLTEYVRFVFNWSLTDPNNRKELILSRFVHVLIERVSLLPPLGLAYMIELSILICQDPDIFTLMFQEFKLLENVFRRELVTDNRYTQSLHALVLFLYQVNELSQRVVLSNEIGFSMIIAIFESSSRHCRKASLEILGRHIGILSDAQVVDFGIVKFAHNMFCADVLNADNLVCAIKLLKKIHARGILGDITEILIALAKKGDENSMAEILQLKTNHPMEYDNISRILSALISGFVERKKTVKILRCIHMLLLQVKYYVHQDMYEMILQFLAKQSGKESGEFSRLMANILSEIIIRVPHPVGDIIPGETLRQSLLHGETIGLKAIIRVLRDKNDRKFLFSLVDSWKLSNGHTSNEMLLLIALLVFDKDSSELPRHTIPLLIGALPGGNVRIRDLVLLCLVEILKRNDEHLIMLASPSRIAALLNAIVIHDMDERILIIACELIFRLWNSVAIRRVLLSIASVSETTLFLLRCTQNKLPLTLVSLLPSLDAEIPPEGALFQTIDVSAALTSKFHDCKMLQHLSSILLRKNFLNVSDLTESDIQSVCYFRILTRLVTARISRLRAHSRLMDFLVNDLPKAILRHFPVPTMFHYKKSVREEIPLQVSVLIDIINYLRACFLVPCRYDVISESSNMLERISSLTEQQPKTNEAQYNVQIRSEVSRMITCARMRV